MQRERRRCDTGYAPSGRERFGTRACVRRSTISRESPGNIGIGKILGQRQGFARAKFAQLTLLAFKIGSIGRILRDQFREFGIVRASSSGAIHGDRLRRSTPAEIAATRASAGAQRRCAQAGRPAASSWPDTGLSKALHRAQLLQLLTSREPRLPRRDRHSPMEQRQRREPRRRIVGPQAQTIFSARGQHPVRLAHAVQRQIVDHHRHIAELARSSAAVCAAQHFGGGVHARRRGPCAAASS
jgi:hypothetical protein